MLPGELQLSFLTGIPLTPRRRHVVLLCFRPSTQLEVLGYLFPVYSFLVRQHRMPEDTTTIPSSDRLSMRQLPARSPTSRALPPHNIIGAIWHLLKTLNQGSNRFLRSKITESHRGCSGCFQRGITQHFEVNASLSPICHFDRHRQHEDFFEARTTVIPSAAARPSETAGRRSHKRRP